MTGILLRQLAEAVGGTVEGNGELVIREAASIATAAEDEITLADAPELADAVRNCSAAAVVVPLDFPELSLPRIVTADVHRAFATIVSMFRPEHRAAASGVSPQACIDPSATIGSDTTIYPLATVGPDVQVGRDCTIHSGVQLAAGCRLGDGVTIFPNVVLYENTVVGSGTTIHAGAVIGAYGFGYRTVEGRHQRGAQLGHVEIGCDVEVGAGTTIDRGTYDATRIGDGTKIDNQVMIGHNCRLGKHNLICSQVGIAGSCQTGDYVVMAGQVGLADHLTIGDRAVLGAKAGLMNDVPADAVFIGVPATPEREQWRMWGNIRQLPQIRKQLKRLLKAVDAAASDRGATERGDAA